MSKLSLYRNRHFMEFEMNTDDGFEPVTQEQEEQLHKEIEIVAEPLNEKNY